MSVFPCTSLNCSYYNWFSYYQSNRFNFLFEWLLITSDSDTSFKNLYWTFVYISPSNILFKVFYVFLFGCVAIKGSSILWYLYIYYMYAHIHLYTSVHNYIIISVLNLYSSSAPINCKVNFRADSDVFGYTVILFGLVFNIHAVKSITVSFVTWGIFILFRKVSTAWNF